MSKETTLSDRESRYKQRAEHCLAETQKILREPANERHRHARQRKSQSNIVAEVRRMLQGA